MDRNGSGRRSLQIIFYVADVNIIVEGFDNMGHYVRTLALEVMVLIIMHFITPAARVNGSDYLFVADTDNDRIQVVQIVMALI